MGLNLGQIFSKLDTSNEPVSEAVELLVGRMKAHPKEFLEGYWREFVEDYGSLINEKEIELVNEAYTTVAAEARKKRREEMHAAVLEKIMNANDPYRVHSDKGFGQAQMKQEGSRVIYDNSEANRHSALPRNR